MTKIKCAMSFAIATISILSCGNTWAGEDWLHRAPPFPHKDWREIQNGLYLDLGDDPEALSKLSSNDFVVDFPEIASSASLKCPAAYKKYLIRSFFLGSKTASVYKTPNGLVVSAGAFSEPRAPEKGAIAICLTADPGIVEGVVSFLK